MQFCKRALLNKVEEKELKTPEPRPEAFSIKKCLPSSEKGYPCCIFRPAGAAQPVGGSKYDLLPVYPLFVALWCKKEEKWTKMFFLKEKKCYSRIDAGSQQKDATQGENCFKNDNLFSGQSG